jgi:hypothetical protein
VTSVQVEVVAEARVTSTLVCIWFPAPPHHVHRGHNGIGPAHAFWAMGMTTLVGEG